MNKLFIEVVYLYIICWIFLFQTAWWSRSQLRPWTLYGKPWGTWRTSPSRAVKPTRRRTRSSSTSSGRRTTTTSTRGETGRGGGGGVGRAAFMSRTIELIASQPLHLLLCCKNSLCTLGEALRRKIFSRVEWCGLTRLWDTDQHNQFYSSLIKSADLNVAFLYLI